ncbi:AIR synthase-related protein [Agriterribacter sp.]|uniref:AIR synthase-related protein n=1 Tax=Agriterribacter sp. TaxID=2821509 RepID=UPI002BD35BAE|nr:AIR synthase-related protein [Agriterribacter sp.]HRO45145.1 AIR synthase-related protein [Agriterribacter sp.]
MSLYNERGVSAQKEEVHAAVRNLNAGLFPKAFCKMYPDFLGGAEDYVNIMHADGAGTKSILAYLYWKETGDISVWRGIAQDAIVMNLDDLLCVGVYDNLVFNSTIDRNKKRIPGEVLEQVIGGSQEFFEEMAAYGIHIHYLGGETADVGDVVRTIAVNGTMTSRWPKNKLITNEKIQAGDVIVGLAGYGTCAYENEYNSGLGSNGLTSARHDVLSKYYAEKYPETFEPSLSDNVVYIGAHKMTDRLSVDGNEIAIGKLLLSPTRTFAPVLKTLLEENFEAIHGLIHCSGGGQTKCLKYVPEKVRIVKDNLFTPPVIFNIIQKAGNAPAREMYQVFNMGCRLEIYTPEKNAEAVIRAAGQYGVEARVIGRVEASEQQELVIQTQAGELKF